jgi:hypothetical protein
MAEGNFKVKVATKPYLVPTGHPCWWESRDVLLGTAWVQCPVEAALAISRIGKIQIGWVKARAEVLQDRPLQCFRCLEKEAPEFGTLFC